MKQQRWRDPSMRIKTMEALSEGNLFAIYDCETTGLYPYSDPSIYDREKKSMGVEACEIIQFSAQIIRYTKGSFEKVKDFNCYIKPVTPVPDKVESITGITNEFLKDVPTMEKQVKKIISVIGKCDYVVGYNNNGFDDKFIDALCKTYNVRLKVKGSLDVCEMARDLTRRLDISKKLDITVHEFRLQNVYRFYDGPDQKGFHNASVDVEATRYLFEYFVRMYPSCEWKLGTGTERPFIIRCYRWENPKQKRQKRIKIVSREGEFFYDILGKYWGSTEEDLSYYDMAYIRSSTFQWFQNVLQKGNTGRIIQVRNEADMEKVAI